MTLLAPWILTGLVAMALPVVIHLVGRRRAQTHPFAAIEFLLQSNRKMARRLRLRQLLLLVLRVALVGALVLMMAKPAWETPSELPELADGAQSTVLIVDDTMSMGRRVGGQSLFDRARERALSLVGLAGGQAQFAVLSVTRPSGPVSTLTRDSRKLRGAIDHLVPTLSHATLGPALARAATILRESATKPRRVVLISDMAAHGLPGEGPVELPAGVGFFPVDVAPRQPADNGAVVELGTEGSAAPGHRSVAVTARICNYRARAWVTEARLKIDGHDMARGAVSLGPRACGAKRFNHTFATGGVHEVVVSIPADDLIADDARYLRLEVRADVWTTLVDGSPSPVRHRDELFYLETALESPATGQRRIVPSVITPDQLDGRRLVGVDVVVLCNVKNLQPSQVTGLRQFVEKGGGLLITVGDNVTAEAYNAAFGGLLPQQLRGPVAAEGTARDAAFRLGGVDSDHPVLATLWSDQQGGGLRQARFFRAFRLRPAVGGARRVLLRFDDGAPALVEARRGVGRVALFASSADRDWTDLPIRPGYAPLFQQMVRYLAGTPLDASERQARVGSTETVTLEAGIRQLRLEAPDRSDYSWGAAELRGRDAVEVKVDRPGFYRLSASAGEGFKPMLRQSFVANIDPAESRLDKRVLTARAAGGSAQARTTRQVELWHAIGLVLMLLLAGESLLTRRG